MSSLPYKPRSTIAMHRRAANIKMMIDALRISARDIAELCLILNVSDSSVRKYLKAAMLHKAVEAVAHKPPGPGCSPIYRIANDLAASDLTSKAVEAKPISKRERPTRAQMRIAEAAAQGRRMVHHGDDEDYFRLEPKKPAFRCEFESIFFGPAKVTA